MSGGEFSVLVADTGTAATTYTDDTVVAETTYTYRIKAINDHGVSERSRWFHIDIPAAPERPAKPAGLSATASHDRVVLTWGDPGDDSITGYVILRRVRENDVGGEFSVLVADTGTAATTYTDDTVVAETTYTYRIKAINDHGVSRRSRWFHIDIPAAPERPAKPAGLSEDDDAGPSSAHLERTRRRHHHRLWDPDDATAKPPPRAKPRPSWTTRRAGPPRTPRAPYEPRPPTTYRIKAINEHGSSKRSGARFHGRHLDSSSGNLRRQPSSNTSIWRRPRPDQGSTWRATPTGAPGHASKTRFLATLPTAPRATPPLPMPDDDQRHRPGQQPDRPTHPQRCVQR